MRFNLNIEIILLIIFSLSIPLQLGYFFDGAERYVNLRVIIFLSFFYLFYAAFNSKLNLNSYLLLIFSFSLASFFIFIWSFSFSTDSSFFLLKQYVDFFYLALSLIFFYLIRKKVTIKALISSSLIVIYGSLIIISIDTYLRITDPTLFLVDRTDQSLRFVENTHAKGLGIWDLISDNSFYAYKLSSFMFFDSNYTGAYLVALFVLILFTFRFVKSLFFKWLTIFLTLSLIFLSFSRSAYIATIALIILFFLRIVYFKSKRIFIFLLITLIPSSMFMVAFLFAYLMQDGSFVTKVDIFKSIEDVFSAEFLRTLFGYGFQDGGYVYSYKKGAYAHALIPLLLGQVGIVGTVLYIFLLIFLSLKSCFYGWSLFVSMMLLGLSLINPYQIIYFYIFSVIILLNKFIYHRRSGHDYDINYCSRL